MMLVFLLIASLAIWSGEVSAQKKAPTSLSLLTDDFLTLSRIVNAIYLRTSQVQKTMKARDVVSELLEINPSDLTEMLSTDIDSALVKFEIWRTNRNYTDASFDKDTMRDSIDWLKLMLSWDIGFDEYLEMPRVIYSIGAIRNNFDLIMTDCTIDKDFYDIADFYHMDRDEVGRIAPEKDLEPFKNNLKQFLKCYRDILELQGVIKQKKEIQEKYFMLRLIPDLMKVLGKIKDTAHKIRMDFDTGRPVWEHQSGTDISTVIKKLFDIEKRRGVTTPPLPILTVSFHTPQDLLKVPNDLKSKFFEKHFVKGAKKRFKKLKEFMEPFNKIAKEIQGLHKGWLEFEKVLDAKGERSSLLKSIPESTAQVENSFDNGQNYSDYAKSADDILTECVGQPTKEYLELSEQIKKKDIEITKFGMEDLPILGGLVDRVIGAKALVNGAEMLIRQDCLEKTLQYFQQVNLTTDKWVVLHNSTKYFYYCSKHYNVTKRRLTSLLKDFRGFFDHVTNMNKVTMEKTSALSADTWSKLVKSSNIDFATNCLRNKSIQLDGLPSVGRLVKKVKHMPVSDSFTQTVDYLKNLKKIKQLVEKVEASMKSPSTRHRRAADNAILVLNDTRTYAENLGVCSRALNDLTIVQSKKTRLLAVEPFNLRVKQFMLSESGLHNYLDPVNAIERLVGETMEIEEMAKELRKKDDVVAMAEIFEPISRLRGIEGKPSAFEPLIKKVPNDRVTASQMQLLMNTQLDFAMYESRLKDGRHTVVLLKDYFDKVFGHKTDSSLQHTQMRMPIFEIIFIIAVIVFVLVVVFMGTGLAILACTKKGRARYVNLWIFYSGNKKYYEKRWRYSCFTDKIEDRNVVLDAVREGNKTSLLNAMKQGAYINAYNSFGNTGLHLAVKECFPELVEILIRNGADRHMLNTMNKTAREMIPSNYKVTHPNKIEQYDKIQAIFRKLKNKKFRMRVPLKFPHESFHIYIDYGTNIDVANNFQQAFFSIVSEDSSRHTHAIMKVNDEGQLETDSMDVLHWIFKGTIIVKESWMAACLDDMRLIKNDADYLVDTVKYRGQCYDTVKKWSMAMAKSEIPYLFGIQVAVVMKSNEKIDLVRLVAIVEENGGVMLTAFPLKHNYNLGSRPYLHSHLGPIFLIHDGTTDLAIYRDDPDKMFTLFTEAEFMDFMLKREFQPDKRQNPIKVVKEVEEE